MLFNVQSVNQESGSAIRELQNSIQGFLTALEMIGIQTENYDCLLVYMCPSKLPKLTLSLCKQSKTRPRFRRGRSRTHSLRSITAP